jgi:predicted nucleic acid-binding Zn ribbon protein
MSGDSAVLTHSADILLSAMPTYVYRFVDTNETIEIQQSFSDPTLTEAVHPGTGATMAVKKVFQPVGVTFKGDGFYKTDSRSGKKSASAASGPADTAATSTSTDSSSTSSSSAPSESKATTSDSSKSQAPKAAPASSGSSST